MKLFTNDQIFIAKQIIEHKMPKIESEKWTTRSVNIGGKFSKVFSRNGGSYFKRDGINYYVAAPGFKEVKSVKLTAPKSQVADTPAE